MVNFIEKTKKIQSNTSIEVKTVGYSVSNNIIPVLRFTQPSEKNKDIMLILARQHPCETVGSFIAEKLISQLIDKNKISSFLMR